MNSIRRSNRFDKRQLVTVVLRNGGKAGCGVSLEGKEPPGIASLSKYMYVNVHATHICTHKQNDVCEVPMLELKNASRYFFHVACIIF